MLAWLVDEQQIEPHIPVFDKSERSDGTVSRADFSYDPDGDFFLCPAGKQLHKRRRRLARRWAAMTPPKSVNYRAAKRDCEACALKLKCCPHEPVRKVPRSIHEAARDKARAIAKTEAYVVSRKQRKKVEMLFAHLKRVTRAPPTAPARPPRRPRRVPPLAATAQRPAQARHELVARTTPALAT